MSQTHILVIDDNPENVQVLLQGLRLEGYEASALQTPQEVREQLENMQGVDIVFLDIEMPDMDGYAMFSYLRSLKQFRHVPIVAYSVHLNEMHTVREIGFAGFVGKPLNIDRLASYVVRILRGENVWEAS